MFTVFGRVFSLTAFVVSALLFISIPEPAIADPVLECEANLNPAPPTRLGAVSALPWIPRTRRPDTCVGSTAARTRGTTWNFASMASKVSAQKREIASW